MDIRVVNRGNEVINVSRLNIMAEGKYILGKSEKNDVVVVERFESEEKAKEEMSKVIWVIEKANEVKQESIIIDFRENKAEYEIKKKYDMPY